MKKTIQVDEKYFNSFINWIKMNAHLNAVEDVAGNYVNYYCNNVLMARISFGNAYGVCTETYEVEQEYERNYLNSQRNKKSVIGVDISK